MIIDNLITLCIERDIEIWKRNAGQILDKINVKNYNLIVPKSQIKTFKQYTPTVYNIISESDINPNVTKINLQKKLPDKLKNNTGWYLQQIIKIEALIKLKGETGLIWDSDTIPLKQLEFINKDGSLNYYVGTEYHAEYFLTNQKLISKDRKVEFSFIAQCFPAYVKEIKELIDLIEKNNSNKIWYESMLEKLSGNIIQGFSEYELMGNYLHDKSKYKMNYLEDKKWSREGKRIFKTYNNLNKKIYKNLAEKYDFIAIEGGLDLNKFMYIINKIKNKYRIK
jgi:hypothetical protein